jgi:hypothetical protein
VWREISGCTGHGPLDAWCGILVSFMQVNHHNQIHIVKSGQL